MEVKYNYTLILEKFAVIFNDLNIINQADSINNELNNQDLNIDELNISSIK